MHTLFRHAQSLLLMLCLAMQGGIARGHGHPAPSTPPPVSSALVEDDCPHHAALQAVAEATPPAMPADCSEGECRCCPCALSPQPVLALVTLLPAQAPVRGLPRIHLPTQVDSAPHAPPLRPPIGISAVHA